MCLGVCSDSWYQQQQRSRYDKEKLSFDVALRFLLTLKSQFEGRKIQRFLIHSVKNSLQKFGDEKNKKRIKVY